MIVVQDVYKRYSTPKGPGPWVLRGVNITIPPRTNVGLIGRNGAGKSTLLRLIGGIDEPTRGKIERHCRVSWPMARGGGTNPALTGRQNSKFVCRLYGHEDDMEERIQKIREFSGLGRSFEEPVVTYSAGMKSRLQFAMSLAFDFDIYISDEVTGAGDASFRKRAADAFRELVDRSGIIMVSHGEETLRKFCKAGIFLNGGLATWFDDINNALDAYKESIAA